MFKVLSWNCQGAAKKRSSRTFRELVSIHKPGVAIIMKPRVSGGKAARIIRRLRFSHSHRIEARSFAGGIWLLWNEYHVQVQVLYNHTQILHVRVTKARDSFLLSTVYASPQAGWRNYCWRNIEALSQEITEPWLLVGDFNAILEGLERKDRLGRQGKANVAFQQCIFEAKLIDLGSNCGDFTWKRAGDQARLDHFLCNDAWRIKNTEAAVTHLPYTCSDHRPILIKEGLPHPQEREGLSGSKPILENIIVGH
ncbi:hypothetical protein Tsubulata_011699 [Turnera subulata]|uniref:Endonuclease/exonuclease/phosphatase domain-containing protein n=1 Tax=Turnera subulata TaxID=218843 RepID=A0A9Q0G7E6_9ROSI|nr:hypothetical protein Tsubulata_011699 [Turnera subulata]